MATEKQKKVVEKLVENRRLEKPIGTGEILREAGYSEGSIIKPSQVIRSKGVQEELKPFIKKLQNERNRLMNAIEIKDLDNVEYKKMIESLDILNKNIQLLSGGDTERQRIIVLPKEIIESNGITPSTSEDSN